MSNHNDRQFDSGVPDRPYKAVPGVGGVQRVAVRRQIRLGWIVTFTSNDGEFGGTD